MEIEKDLKILKQLDVLRIETPNIYFNLKRNIDAAKKTGMGGYIFDGDVVKLREYLGCPNS